MGGRALANAWEDQIPPSWLEGLSVIKQVRVGETALEGLSVSKQVCVGETATLLLLRRVIWWCGSTAIHWLISAAPTLTD